MAPTPSATAAGQGALDTTPVTKLAFAPSVRPNPNVGAPYYLAGFTGRDCLHGVCTDPAVPADATWSLDFQDSAAGSPVVTIASGTGTTVSGEYPFTFPTEAPGTSGALKVWVTFTSASTQAQWSNYVLAGYGPDDPAPSGPTRLDTDLDPNVGSDVPVNVPLTVTATGGRVAAGSAAWQDVFDWGDGSPADYVDVTAPAAGDQPVVGKQHVYTQPGTYQIYVSVFDGVNQSEPYSIDITVSADAAKFTATPAEGKGSAESPFVVTLDGTASTAGAGAALTATSFDFSCDYLGAKAVPVPGEIGKATCTYTAAGTFTPELTLTDSLGNVSHAHSAFVTVGAGPNPPNLNLFQAGRDSAPLTGVADLNEVRVDPSANPANVTYKVDWGDGHADSYTGTTLPASKHLTHLYAAANRYTITLTVNDGLGLSGSRQQQSVQVEITPPPPGPTPVYRAAGTDRFDTGVLVSHGLWASATDTSAPAYQHPNAVVLATGQQFPDALAGVPFASKVDGALLLTESARLTPEVGAEIQRILPRNAGKTVYILGGTSAVSPAVASALTSLGYRVQRISGADRYATSLAIAHAMGDPAHVIVARGDDFADALSAGPLATDLFGTGSGTAYTPAAIVLTDNKSVDSATKSYIHGKLAAHGLDAIAVGGGAAAALGTVPGVSDGNAGAVVGTDRYDTARAVADIFRQVDPKAPIGVATGSAFADALTGGAYMAMNGGPLLLTKSASLPAPTVQAVRSVWSTTSEVDVFGGPNAVSATVFGQLVSMVHGVARSF